MTLFRRAAFACVALALAGSTSAPLGADDAATYLPTGMRITPTAAAGSTFERLQTGLRADGNADATDATALALSPDGKTLLALTAATTCASIRTTARRSRIRRSIRKPADPMRMLNR